MKCTAKTYLAFLSNRFPPSACVSELLGLFDWVCLSLFSCCKMNRFPLLIVWSNMPPEETPTPFWTEPVQKSNKMGRGGRVFKFCPSPPVSTHHSQGTAFSATMVLWCLGLPLISPWVQISQFSVTHSGVSDQDLF